MNRPTLRGSTFAPGPAPKNLTARIVEDLGAAIVTGKYSDANPIPVEAVLCTQYQASRSVLREAVKMLTAKGLLTARPRQGTRVQPEDAWNLLDPDVLRWMLQRKFSVQLLIQFTELRLAVEPGAAALAARAATPEQRTAIAHAVERMLAAAKGQDDALDSDIAFHAAILNASGNPFYAQLREFIETALRFSIRRTNAATGETAALEHKAVGDAVIAGDAPKAERLMRELIQDALNVLLDTGRTRGKRQRGYS